MIKRIIFISILVLSGNQITKASTTDEIMGKSWQKVCIENKKSLASCCNRRGNKCRDEAKTKKEQKACKEKTKECRTKTLKTGQKKIEIKKK
ncbi:MAG: hypothetical protein SD837_21990 [Candidatus Electrothrix scaldis]|nr:MAG: hypothetical protein SD837_21990 [Candidatus Electrothrix sp. GW3-3]